MRGFGGVDRAALRAGHFDLGGGVRREPQRGLARRLGAALGRRDAVGAQLLARLGRHPVGGPGGGELGDDAAFDARALQHGADVVGDLVHGGAAAVGGSDDHLDAAVGAAAQVAQDAHLAQGDDGDLGVGQLVERAPERRELRLPLPRGGRGLG